MQKPPALSESLLRFRLLISRFRWAVFVLGFVAVLKLKDVLALDDRRQMFFIGLIGLFAAVAGLDEYLLRRKRSKRELYVVLAGDLLVVSLVLLALPADLAQYKVLFMLPISLGALVLGSVTGVLAAIFAVVALPVIASIRGEDFLRNVDFFWSAVFLATGAGVGYAFEKWDLAQRHLEQAAEWVGKINVAMTLGEIGESTLDYLAAVARVGEKHEDFASAFLLLDQRQDRYCTVASRNLSAEAVARLWLPASGGILSWALKKGDPLRLSIDEPNNFIRLPRLNELNAYSSLLFVPLVSQGSALALAMLFVTEDREGSKEALRAVAEFSRKVADIMRDGMFHEGLGHHAGAAGAILESSHNLMGQGPNEILAWAMDAARQLVGADAAAVATVDNEKHLVIKMASGVETDLAGYDLNDGSSWPEWVLRMAEPVMIADCGTDKRIARGSLIEKELGCLTTAPLRVYGQVAAVLLAGKRAKGSFSAADVRLLTMLGQQVTLLLEQTKSLSPVGGGQDSQGEKSDVLGSVVHVLSLVVEANKRYLEGSSQRVSSLAVAIGQKMGCSTEELTDLEYSALLRDVGIVGIEGGLLDRAHELSEEEMKRVRRHPAVGEEILSSLPFIWQTPRIVRHHHERYDGSGYPDFLKGENIPLAARILSVADVFDALTSNRPYRQPLSVADARDVVVRASGSQFDPRAVDAFRAVYRERYDAASWLSSAVQR